MSFNNIRPAWAIFGDNAIQNYVNGKITFDTAMDTLEELSVDQGMKERLMKCMKEKEQQ